MKIFSGFFQNFFADFWDPPYGFWLLGYHVGLYYLIVLYFGRAGEMLPYDLVYQIGFAYLDNSVLFIEIVDAVKDNCFHFMGPPYGFWFKVLPSPLLLRVRPGQGWGGQTLYL